MGMPTEMGWLTVTAITKHQLCALSLSLSSPCGSLQHTPSPQRCLIKEEAVGAQVGRPTPLVCLGLPWDRTAGVQSRDEPGGQAQSPATLTRVDKRGGASGQAIQLAFLESAGVTGSGSWVVTAGGYGWPHWSIPRRVHSCSSRQECAVGAISVLPFNLASGTLGSYTPAPRAKSPMILGAQDPEV